MLALVLVVRRGDKLLILQIMQLLKYYSLITIIFYVKFRFLSRLLLVHGRYSYKRTTKLILYCFYKNMVSAFPLFFFGFFSGFSCMELYDSLLVSTYNVFFTSLPILFIADLDRECTTEEQHAYPELYIPGRLRKGFDLGIFLSWCLVGIRDAVIVFFVPYYALSQNANLSDLATIGTCIYSTAIFVGIFVGIFI